MLAVKLDRLERHNSLNFELHEQFAHPTLAELRIWVRLGMMPAITMRTYRLIFSNRA